MKLRKLISKSIYSKLAFVFLSIWWFFNIITLGMILRLVTGDSAQELHQLVGIVFINNAVLGTVVLLLVLRSIVKPIKQLSKATRSVGKGDFDVTVSLKNQDEIGQLAVEFNEMVKEINSMDKMRKEFVSNVSHEFRTPITSIRGFAKLIEKSDCKDLETKEYAKTIVKESERLIDLSANLLRLSEIETKVIHLKNEFSLDEQIRQVILSLEPQWSKKNIALDIELSSAVYVGDEDLLYQVWLNLIQNAIKFSAMNGMVKVELMTEIDAIQVIITDTGAGIAKKDIPRIFDRFYQGESFQKNNGNGLGLAIVQRIIETEGGNLTVTSELGSGTKIVVRLKRGEL